MKRFLPLLVPAVALLLLGGQARADILTTDKVNWTYNFSPGAPAVFADNHPTAAVTFTNEPTQLAVGDSDVVATNLRANSTAKGKDVDVVKNGNYSLTLVVSNLSDPGSPSATFTFHGKLSGKWSTENANIANAFAADNLQTKSIGSFNFTVFLQAYTPPGPPDQKQVGSISAHVSISTGSIDHQPAPEPSTMILSGLGMTFLGMAAWRKRRNRARPALAVA